MKEYIVQAIEQETIDSFDAHNAPELIRCKDCKHFEIENENIYGFCKINHGNYIKADWFCADGVRKDD